MTKRLFKNARIYSAQEKDDKLHQALVVDGEKVAFLGSDVEAAAHAAVSISVALRTDHR